MPKRKSRSLSKVNERPPNEDLHADEDEKRNEAPDSYEPPGEGENMRKKRESLTNLSKNDTNNNLRHFTVPLPPAPSSENKSRSKSHSITCELHHPASSPSSPPVLLFTHGAGGGLDAPATRDFATGFRRHAPLLAFAGNLNLTNRVRRFHAVWSSSSTSPSPSSLEAEAEAEPTRPLALGGRSMGARAAVLALLEPSGTMEEGPTPGALVLVSYPLRTGSGGREPERREKPLLALPGTVDVLFIIGSRDAQCGLAELGVLRGEIQARTWLVEVEGAGHGMEVRGGAGGREMREKTGEVAAEWLRERSEGQRFCLVRWDTDDERVVGSEWQEEEERREVEGETVRKRKRGGHAE